MRVPNNESLAQCETLPRKAIPDKATLPDFPFFSRADHPHVPYLHSSQKNYISVTRIYFSGINFPKITYQGFVVIRELHGNRVWELFSWRISFQLHEIMFSELILQ